MHILMYRWKAYNYRDIEQTFLLLGHTVDNIQQKLGSYDVEPEFERVITSLPLTRQAILNLKGWASGISGICRWRLT